MDGNALEAIYERGFQFRCSGQYAEARVELMKVLDADPGHIGARHQLGLIQGFEGDFDGSVATLQAISNQVPQNLDVKYDLAMTLMMIGEFDVACAKFQEILAVNPSHKAAEQVVYCP